MRINTAHIQRLFLNDPTNQKLIQQGWKPSTDHIICQLTRLHNLTLKQQQRIHQIGCEIYGLEAAE